MTRIFFILILISIELVQAGVFNNAIKDELQKQLLVMNGYVRGVLYGARESGKEEPIIQTAYGDISLKLNIKPSDLAEAFGELRFSSEYLYDGTTKQFDIREAYIAIHPGIFDICLGKQIIVWGRADGINPTNNITPLNMSVRSPENDDRRDGNFLTRLYINLLTIRFEFIWIPIYRSQTLLFDLIELPYNMEISEPQYPDKRLKNSSFAFRLNLQLPTFDGSISYYNGFHPSPGVSNGEEFGTVAFKAYRTSIIGGDFQFIVGNLFGLRGEGAYRYPHENYNVNFYVPNPEFQIVLGADKDIGMVTILAQYLLKYVQDFGEIQDPSSLSPFFQINMIQYQLERVNRILTNQTKFISHLLLSRLNVRLCNENLLTEITIIHNISTEESGILPQIKYNISDAVSVLAGVDFYRGNKETLFGNIKNQFNTAYMELKVSF